LPNLNFQYAVMTITEPDVSELNQFISDPNSAKNKRSDKKHFTQIN